MMYNRPRWTHNPCNRCKFVSNIAVKLSAQSVVPFKLYAALSLSTLAGLWSVRNHCAKTSCGLHSFSWRYLLNGHDHAQRGCPRT